MITHAKLKVILHINAIVHIMGLVNNFSVIWNYFLGWNMNEIRMLLIYSFIFINTELEHIDGISKQLRLRRLFSNQIKDTTRVCDNISYTRTCCRTQQKERNTNSFYAAICFFLFTENCIDKFYFLLIFSAGEEIFSF